MKRVDVLLGRILLASQLWWTLSLGVGVSFDEQKTCSINGVVEPFTGFRIERDYITKNSRPPLFHVSGTVSCHKGLIGQQSFNRLPSKYTEFEWDKIYCVKNDAQRLSKRLINYKDLVKKKDYSRATKKGAVGKYRKGGKPKDRLSRDKKYIQINKPSVDSANEVETLDLDFGNVPGKNYDGFDTIEINRPSGEEKKKKQNTNNRSLYQPNRNYKKGDYNFDQDKLENGDQKELKDEKENHNVDQNYDESQKEKTDSDELDNSNEEQENNDNGRKETDNNESDNVNENDNEEGNDNSENEIYQNEHLVCYKFARRKHLSKRKFIILEGNHFIGGVFQCRLSETTKHQIMAKPFELLTPLDFPCEGAVPFAPLVTEDPRHQWVQQEGQYQVKRVPFLYTSVNLLDPSVYQTPLKRRPIFMPSVTDLPNNWSEFVEASENYNFTFTDLQAIQYAADHTVQLYQYIEDREITAFPWNQLENLPLDRKAATLTTLLQYNALSQRVLTLFNSLPLHEASHYLSQLQDIWDSVATSVER